MAGCEYYALGYFGVRGVQAKKAYVNLIQEGVAQGGRDDSTGGGLIRSLSAWTEAKQ